MNIVYPYRKNDSRELEWSLKSVRKNLEGDVIIIGDTPDFEVDATVITGYGSEWRGYSPYHNVIDKILQACQLYDEFVLMNDDFFVLNPIDITKHYNRGNMLDHMNARKFDSYTRALHNTRNLLSARGHTDVDFEVHTPMLINSKQMIQAIYEIMPQLRNSQTILIRSYYGNRYGLVSETISDVKNPGNYKELDVISTNEDTFKGEIGEYIKEKLS